MAPRAHPAHPGRTASGWCLALALLAGCRSRATPPDRPGETPAASAAASAAAPAPSASVDAVSHASPWATGASGGPAAVLGGVVDGEALRRRSRALLSRSTPVVVLQGGTPAELGERLCQEVIPRRPPATPVLLKPNIGGFDHFMNPALTGGDDGLRGRLTDPGFVRGVIRCLKARGHDRITVADSFGGGPQQWRRLVAASGYEAMARDEGVPLVALSDDGRFDVEGGRPGEPLAISGLEQTRVPSLRMARLLAEHLREGLFVSLPRVKTHRFAVVSLGIKGLQGTVMLGDGRPAYQQRWRMHRELGRYLEARKRGEPEDRAAYVAALLAFADRMVDVLELEAPDAVLADGAPASGGDGFETIWPAPGAPVAIGGENTILVDRVGAAYLGLYDSARLAAQLGGHSTSPLITRAAARFGLDLRAPELRGDGAGRIAAHPPTHFVAMAPFAIHDDAARPSLAPALAP